MGNTNNKIDWAALREKFKCMFVGPDEEKFSFKKRRGKIEFREQKLKTPIGTMHVTLAKMKGRPDIPILTASIYPDPDSNVRQLTGVINYRVMEIVSMLCGIATNKLPCLHEIWVGKDGARTCIQAYADVKQ